MVGKYMIPTVPFQEAYFLEDALKFRQALQMPLVYVGGLVARQKIDEVINHGFEAVRYSTSPASSTACVARSRPVAHASTATTA